jgi:hypothetical protein
MPSWVTRYRGRTALTDSDEMSVRRLLTPSSLTLRWTRFDGALSPEPGAPGPSGPPGFPAASGAGRSRTEEYNQALPASADNAVAWFQANLTLISSPS